MKYNPQDIDPYCYPNTNVLINLLNIKDFSKLETEEAQVGILKTYLLEKTPLKGDYDLTHLQEIHKYLFEDIYS